MKLRWVMMTLLFSSVAHGADHGNLDAGRPLSFEDAEASAWGERQLEIGAAASRPDGGRLQGAAEIGVVLGVLPDTHVSFEAGAEWAARPGEDHRLERGPVSLGILHNLNREFGAMPAMSVAMDVAPPTAQEAHGVDIRWRGVASRHLAGHVRGHLNGDLVRRGSPETGERRWQRGFLAGLSRPIGLPRHFQTTALAEVGLREAAERRHGNVGIWGAGLRRQIGYRSVGDLGIEGEWGTRSGAPHEKWSVRAGWALAF